MKKKRKCREKSEGCNIQYTPWTGNIQRQGDCQNPGCLLSKAEKNRAKKQARDDKKERAVTRQQKQDAKTRSKLLSEAQIEFNKYIRVRDHGKPCISCGRHHQGKMDAGHYQTTKARPGIRFHPSNNHAQCQPCNRHLSGNIIEYRINLQDKEGQEIIDYLERGDHWSGWSREEIIEIKLHYRDLTKQLREDRG
jgi:hypothetical protein